MILISQYFKDVLLLPLVTDISCGTKQNRNVLQLLRVRGGGELGFSKQVVN